jgi:outer membrane murein-binding lipoprotein Lpp
MAQAISDLNWLPELVATGFLGFAVSIMFFSYRLLSGLVSSEKPGSVSVMRQKVRTIYVFLGLSMAVIFLGIIFTFFAPTPNMNLRVSVIPENKRWEGVRILVRDSNIQLYDPNNTSDLDPAIRVVKDERIVLDLSALNERIAKLERDVDVLSKQASGATEAAKANLTANFTAPSTEDGL